MLQTTRELGSASTQLMAVHFPPIANVDASVIPEAMIAENLTPLKRAAAASLAASLLLVTIPFAVPNMSIAPYAFANWCLFMLFSYLYLRSFRWPITFGDAELARMKLWMVVFLAFTVACWVALANTNNLV